MITNARTHTESAAHFYLPDGTPLYEVPYADPKKGMRAATLADARKVGALPSPTTIGRCLAKPELQTWLTEQAVLAVLTTPRQPGENDDAFVHRVLHVEKVQDQERDTAADFGSKLHSACAAYFAGQEVSPDLRPWIMPAMTELRKLGQYVTAEKVLVGDGYAGCVDLILESPDYFYIIDYKSTKKLPDKGAWKDHIIQASAYAAAFRRMLMASEPAPDRGAKPIHTAICYISSTEQSKFAIWPPQEPWEITYSEAFVPLLKIWGWMNNYWPTSVART